MTQYDIIESNDVLLCFSSLYWISGWFTLLLGTLNGATRIITTQTFTAELQFNLVEKYKVTFACNAPHHMALMLRSDCLDQADLSSLKFQLVPGGKCPLHVQNAISSRMPNGHVHAGYGLSEAASVMTCNLGNKDSAGQLLSFYTLKIIDEDGNRCGIDEDGEICFKTNYKFLGYYGNQKATYDSFDDDGFFLTGDIGHFDEDGDLFIVDRKKDLLKYCNYQISPSEIESYLIRSPDIKLACVVGIPDEVAVDLPAAFIVRNERSNITENDVFNMIAGIFERILFESQMTNQKYFGSLFRTFCGLSQTKRRRLFCRNTSNDTVWQNVAKKSQRIIGRSKK